MQLVNRIFYGINGFDGTIYSFFMSLSSNSSSTFVSSREDICAFKLILLLPLYATIATMPTIDMHVRQKNKVINVWLSISLTPFVAPRMPHG